jgi:tetratricopeptide (TPR) repeat protein
VEVAERPFPDDSLYPLLVAEFALRRQAYGIALENYRQQAQLLDDAGVAAHATRLAQYVQNEQATLDMVQLWLQLDPDDLEANNTAATALTRQGRGLEALPHLAVIARSGHQANFPSVLNGFGQQSPQQKAELIAGLNALAEEFPDDPALLLTQATIHAEFDQLDAALAKLEDLFAIDPYQPQGMLLEARILLRQEARSPYRRIDAALEADPENKQLRLLYARLLAANDIVAARKQFEILSAQNPRDGDLLLSLALINREVGDDLEARAYLRQLLELQQRVTEAHYYLGRIAEDAGKEDEALAEYQQVGEGRELMSATQRAGRILLARGDLQQLRDWFAQLRANFPQRTEQLYGLQADLLSNSGYGAEAMQTLTVSLGEFPDSASLRYARAMLAEQRDDLALLESDLRHIIANDPENATALNALGYTLADRTNRFDEAYDLIDRALVLSPEEPAILDSMGWVLYRLGRIDEALEYLSRAYALFPDPEVAAHLGEVMWVSGDTEGATRVWQGALLKAPQHDTLVSTLQRLGVDSLDMDPLGKGEARP